MPLNNSSPQIETETTQERQPLLFVDVNLGASRSERIIVREGDTAVSLAESFSD